MDPHLALPRRRLLLLVACALVLAPLVASVGTASAHDDKGVMEVTQATQTGPSTVHLEVGVVYEGDGHLAQDAVVTATLTGPDGTTVGPVELAAVSETSSLYAADIEVGGTGSWAATVSSTEPTASATTAIEVAATPATDATGSTDTASTLLEGEDDQVFTANGAEDGAGDDAADEYIDQAASDADDAADSGNSTLFIVLAVAAVALIGGGGLFVYLRRDRPGVLGEGEGTDDLS